jgi:HlyD family secretion protein
MSDDRSSFLPADGHHIYRWGASTPQRALFVLLLCAPLSAHAQEGAAPRDLMQPVMPSGHSMHAGSHDKGPKPPGDIGSAANGFGEAPLSAPPAANATPSRQTFAPNVTGPSLSPSIPEELANKKFGVEGALATARVNTSEMHETLAKPIELGVAFSGPLWIVKKQRLESTVRGYGVVEINEDTLHDAVITQSGVVRGLYVFPGMEVKAGEPLTSIYSPERVNAQHMLLADFSKDEGNQISLQYYSSFSSTQKYLDHSRSNLKWWGFSDEDIDRLLKTEQVKEDYVFQAEQDSYVIEMTKNPGAVVVAGDKSEENFVIPGEQIMRMAKLDTVWGMSFVQPEDNAVFKLGDAILVTVGEGKQARSLQGLIVHKHDNADPKTRMADFHVLLDNRDRSIPPGSLASFGKQLSLEGLWIPTKALLYVQGQPIVIRRAHNGYEAVSVVIDSSSRDFSRIIGG